MPNIKTSQTSFSGLFVIIEYEENIEMIDVWDAYDVISQYKGQTEFYRKYIVPQTSSITKIAQDIYGTQDLWWFILVFNDIVDPFKATFPPDENAVIEGEATLNIIRPEFLPEIMMSIRESKINR